MENKTNNSEYALMRSLIHAAGTTAIAVVPAGILRECFRGGWRGSRWRRGFR